MGNGVVALPSMPVGKTDLSLESFNSGSAVGVTAEQGSQLSSWRPLKVFVVERKGSYLENLGGKGLPGRPVLQSQSCLCRCVCPQATWNALESHSTLRVAARWVCLKYLSPITR